jgi:predicted amidohydrolase
MHAHLVQLDSVWEDRAANHRRVRDLLAAHEQREPNQRIAPGDLVVLPEMFDTGFSFNLEVTADTDGATLAFLRSFAKERQVTLHGARTVLGPDGRGRNRATIVGPGGDILCEYDKIHPFSFGRECERFTGGDEVMTYTWNADLSSDSRGGGSPISRDKSAPEHAGRRLTDAFGGTGLPTGVGGEADDGLFLQSGCARCTGQETSATTAPDHQTEPSRSITIGPAICYDLRFPELFRSAAKLGAEMFVLGANWPQPRKVHREVLSIARAIENQAYMLCVNRAGRDPFLEYAGGTIAVDPQGEVIGRMDEREGVLSVAIDPGLVRSWRAQFPALRDMRLR